MNPCRLLVVCPHYWPDPESRSLLATALSDSFAESGHQVTVVTRHLIGYWPQQFRMGMVNVVRLPQRGSRLMDSVRSIGGRDPWIRELSRWLPDHCQQFDFAIVIACDHEVHSIINVLQRWDVRAVVRIENLASVGVPMEQGKRKPMLVWATPAKHGDKRGGLNFVADGSEANREISDSRKSLRGAFKKAHPMLDVPGEGPLMICSSALEKRGGVFELVTAWQGLFRKSPTARLWMVGSGSDGYRLFQHVRDLDLEHVVIMPGSFDHAIDLVAASDAIVIPGFGPVLSGESDFVVNTALENGIPLICHAENPLIESRDTAPANGGFNNAVSGKLWTFCEPDRPLASVLCQWNEWRLATIQSAESEAPPSGCSLQEMALRYIELGRTMLETTDEQDRTLGPARQEAHSRNEANYYDRR